MKPAQPLNLKRRRVAQLLSATRRDRSIGSRIDTFSRRLLGRPYESNPLIGSPETAEVFTAALDAFDCVTYIETVMAFARASTVSDFTTWLRKIRYEHGEIQWQRRNHYMMLWLRNNVREGILTPVSFPAIPTLKVDRVLNLVPGLEPRRVRMRCIPKRSAPRLERYLQTGDLIFFASTRKHLDVFHAGIIVRDADSILMRHASRSRGAVVEQKLSEFLKANRMSGVIVARP